MRVFRYMFLICLRCFDKSETSETKTPKWATACYHRMYLCVFQPYYMLLSICLCLCWGLMLCAEYRGWNRRAGFVWSVCDARTGGFAGSLINSRQISSSSSSAMVDFTRSKFVYWFNARTRFFTFYIFGVFLRLIPENNSPGLFRFHNVCGDVGNCVYWPIFDVVLFLYSGADRWMS